VTTRKHKELMGMVYADRRKHPLVRQLYAALHWGLIDLDFATMLHRIAVLLTLAFAGVIVVTWANEVYDLPYRLGLSDATPVNYAEAATETLWALIVLLLVLVSTRALLKQIRYLEGFLPVCSYCKKIRDAGGSWIELETFMQRRAHVTMTHSLCPACAKQHYGYEE